MFLSQSLNLFARIRQFININEFGRGKFIDLKKAFDTVSHAILLTKLNHCGIRGNAHEWFKLYLCHRGNSVIVSGHDSISLPLTCSVPQGSILGHHSFLLYLNDLPNTSSLLTFHLCADDTNLYLYGKNLNHLERILNQELKSVVEWMKCNPALST